MIKCNSSEWDAADFDPQHLRHRTTRSRGEDLPPGFFIIWIRLDVDKARPVARSLVSLQPKPIVVTECRMTGVSQAGSIRSKLFRGGIDRTAFQCFPSGYATSDET